MPDEIPGGEATTDVTPPAETETPWVTPESGGGEVATGESTSSPTYKVTVGGEEIEVSLDEALAGYQRQADYTRKTQELATQRTEMEYAARLAQALETDPARAIDALQQAYQVSLGTPQAAAPQVTESLDPEEQRFATLEARLAAQEQAAFERQVSAQLAELHSQYGQFDDVELVKFAVERNIPNLDDAAKVFVFDKTFTKINADKAAAAAKQTAPPVASGHGVQSGAVTPGASESKPTIEEALRAAMAAHS